MLYKYNEIPCETCEASGQVSENPDCGLTAHDLSTMEWTPCDECEGEGRFLCDECDGEGVIEVSDDECEECEKCDGWGYTTCLECSGEGFFPETCNDCHGRVDEHDTMWVGDGFIVCDLCARQTYKATMCQECEGDGFTTFVNCVLDNRIFPVVDQECSCCGSRPDPEYGVWIFEAHLYDSDGIFFLFLCGDRDGQSHCLETVLDQQDEVEEEKKLKAKVAKELLGDDIDGIWAECSDE